MIEVAGVTQDALDPFVPTLEAEVRLISGDIVRGAVTSMKPGHLIMNFDGVAMVSVPYSAVRRIGTA